MHSTARNNPMSLTTLINIIWHIFLYSPQYFPPASLGWIIYCILVAIVFTGLKVINHGLHHMYDTKECIVVQPTTDPATGNENSQ